MIDKKVIIIVILFFNNLIIAQGSSTIGNVNVTFSIISGLAINTLNSDINFGDIIQPTTNTSVTEDPEFGAKFEIIGESRKRITVNYSKVVSLSNSEWVTNYGGNVGNLNFTANVKHTRKNQNYVTPRNLRNGRTIKLRNSSGIGKLYIWVGGKINLLKNQEVGDYKGVFNITVAY